MTTVNAPPPTSAVHSVVVVPEHHELVLLANSHGGDVGHEVGEGLGGVLADVAGGVRAHRVEVAQGDHVHAVLREEA